MREKIPSGRESVWLSGFRRTKRAVEPSRELTSSKLAALFFCLFLGGGCGDEDRGTATAGQAVRPAPEPLVIPFDVALQGALNGQASLVRQALDSGTHPDQRDGDGRTMLMVSAFNGHTGTVGELLAAGASSDVRDRAGRTALMFASTGKNRDTVALLLANKAQINLIDGQEGWTALMFAAAEGHRSIVELLLQHGADPTVIDVDESTAESFARDNGHTDLADLIRDSAKGFRSAPRGAN